MQLFRTIGVVPAWTSEGSSVCCKTVQESMIGRQDLIYEFLHTTRGEVLEHAENATYQFDSTIFVWCCRLFVHDPYCSIGIVVLCRMR